MSQHTDPTISAAHDLRDAVASYDFALGKMTRKAAAYRSALMKGRQQPRTTTAAQRAAAYFSARRDDYEAAMNRLCTTRATSVAGMVEKLLLAAGADGAHGELVKSALADIEALMPQAFA